MSDMVILVETDTPIGSIQVTAGDTGLRRVDLGGFQPVNATAQIGQNFTSNAYTIARQALQEILEYLTGIRKSFEVILDWSRATSFQKRVLETNLKIPFGEIQTYGQIAESLGQPNTSRAVGAALGRNPIPIIIPCHRVVAANGHLTGFSAADGIRTKQWLLELEGHKIVHQKLV